MLFQIKNVPKARFHVGVVMGDWECKLKLESVSIFRLIDELIEKRHRFERGHVLYVAYVADCVAQQDKRPRLGTRVMTL